MKEERKHNDKEDKGKKKKRNICAYPFFFNAQFANYRHE